MKEALVLHICCAPDEAYVVKSLKDEFDLHCFFCNPNIQPEEEYEKRLQEVKKVSAIYKVPLHFYPYDPESWEKAVENFTETPEGGRRCLECFGLRLEKTAAFCKQNGFSAFATVMSISPHKRIEMLNQAGHKAAEKYDVRYEPYNFKKKNGFIESIKLSNALGLYRQDYCGCSLSKEESEKRKLQRKKSL